MVGFLSPGLARLPLRVATGAQHVACIPLFAFCVFFRPVGVVGDSDSTHR